MLVMPKGPIIAEEYSDHLDWSDNVRRPLTSGVFPTILLYLEKSAWWLFTTISAVMLQYVPITIWSIFVTDPIREFLAKRKRKRKRVKR